MGETKSGSKKGIFFTIFLVLILGGIFSSYFVFKDRFLVRMPVLVLKSARITFLYGNASYRTNATAPWEKAQVGTILEKGAELKTEKNAKADLAFNQGTSVRVGENAHFVLEEMTIKNFRFHLNEGSLYGSFKKFHEKHQINVSSPNTMVGIRGTELGLEVKKEDPQEEGAKPQTQTVVYAISGIVEVYNPLDPDKKILLSYQNQAAINGNQPPLNPDQTDRKKIDQIRKILNSIHTEEVLLITDKILFKFGTAEFLSESSKELDKIAEILQKTSAKIRIEGHTDDVGDAYFNQNLSSQRAMAVRNYLIGKNIPAKRLWISGYGASKPISENADEAGRQQNRRVEFIIME